MSDTVEILPKVFIIYRRKVKPGRRLNYYLENLRVTKNLLQGSKLAFEPRKVLRGIKNIIEYTGRFTVPFYKPVSQISKEYLEPCMRYPEGTRKVLLNGRTQKTAIKTRPRKTHNKTTVFSFLNTEKTRIENH